MLTCLCDYAQASRYVRVEELAAKFRVSVRTVRYDLDKIDYYLKSNGYPKLERAKGTGVILKASQAVIDQIRKTLCEMQVDTYVLSRLERSLYIQMILFTADAPIRYEDLAENLCVSRKTVIEDVRAIKEEDNPHDAHICAAKNGIYYSGDEAQLRKAILDRILRLFTPIELWELGFGIYLNRSIAIEKKWLEIMENSDAAALEELLLQVECAEKLVLSDDQFYLTILLTSLARNRTVRGYPIVSDAAFKQPLPRLFALFFEKIKMNLHWELSSAEQEYVHSEIGRILNDSGHERAEKLADVITETLLVRVSDEFSRKYYLDNALRTGLREHLISVIKNGSNRRNNNESVVQAIVHEHSALLSCIHDCLQQIPGLRLNDQTEQESAFIALHFCAADERRSMSSGSKYKALMVCASGVGTSKILSATVIKHFPQIQVVASSSLHNVQGIVDQHHPDFILTTVPLNCRNMPVIQVNALMTDADVDRVRSFIASNRKPSDDFAYRDIFHELLNVVMENCSIHDQERLERGLMRILGIEKRREPRLLKLVQPECIQIGLEPHDWESAVHLSAQPLVDGGYLEARYVDAMISNIHEMGPYIVIMPGVAMPHSLPQDGVINSCLGISVLKKPVSFGNEANDPVRIILTLGALDNQEHMKEMSDLINLFSNEEVINRICAAKSSDEIMELLRSSIHASGRN